ncbi:hypothetical protein P0136_09345 [Lentisphaerota bacterium ZTH]|nr:hypothetical protein JYG24_13145 [Lentisphaerota bacterium]WET05568.1 hypothetical protein P0136_09345 [Lentisphaerota bacterium ZTH]
MNPRFHNNVLSKVKKTIQKMSQSRPVKNSVPDYLVRMNIPPLMGRRDAAYDCVETILSGSLFSHQDNERKEIYNEAVKLLDISIKDTQAILTALGTEEKSDRENRYLSYLKLLRNITHAAGDMVDYEVSIFNEEKNINQFIGGNIATQLRRMEEIIGESEMMIVQNISELLEAAHPQINKFREVARRSFNRHNGARYKKAFMEFKDILSEESS